MLNTSLDCSDKALPPHQQMGKRWYLNFGCQEGNIHEAVITSRTDRLRLLYPVEKLTRERLPYHRFAPGFSCLDGSATFVPTTNAQLARLARRFRLAHDLANLVLM